MSKWVMGVIEGDDEGDEGDEVMRVLMIITEIDRRAGYHRVYSHSRSKRSRWKGKQTENC